MIITHNNNVVGNVCLKIDFFSIKKEEFDTTFQNLIKIMDNNKYDKKIKICQKTNNKWGDFRTWTICVYNIHIKSL